jgi:hypothetical protein
MLNLQVYLILLVSSQIQADPPPSLSLYLQAPSFLAASDGYQKDRSFF